jgi:hypothetical protein
MKKLLFIILLFTFTLSVFGCNTKDAVSETNLEDVISGEWYSGEVQPDEFIDSYHIGKWIFHEDRVESDSFTGTSVTMACNDDFEVGENIRSYEIINNSSIKINDIMFEIEHYSNEEISLLFSVDNITYRRILIRNCEQIEHFTESID